MISNSAVRKGGAILFFTIFARTRLPMTMPPCFRDSTLQVNADGAVELEGAASGRDLRVPEDDADLLAQLVDEDERGAGAGDGGGELAQRLRHEAGLQSGQRVPHVAFDLGAGGEGGHAIQGHDG